MRTLPRQASGPQRRQDGHPLSHAEVELTNRARGFSKRPVRQSGRRLPILVYTDSCYASGRTAPGTARPGTDDHSVATAAPPIEPIFTFHAPNLHAGAAP